MKTCTHCACLIRGSDCNCPHCGRSSCVSSRTSAAILLGLALSGCVGATPQPKYGVSVSDDADGDGYFDVDQGGDDCDDSDATIHPDAAETVGDGVDSNCDGYDDT